MTDLSALSDDELLASLPRGVRNRNPGNIEDGDFARSLPGYQGGDGRFAVFDSVDNGLAAQSRLLSSYGKRGINTVEGVVNRWAPNKENDTGAYVQFVAKRMGVDPKKPLNMNDPRTVSTLAEVMAEHENGAPIRAADLTSVSDDELLASLGKVKPAQGVSSPRVPQRNQPGSSATNPIILTTANRTGIPDGAYFKTAKGEVRQQKRGAGYTSDAPPATNAARGFKGELVRVANRVAPYSPLALIPGYRERLDQGRPKVQAYVAKQGQPVGKAGEAGAFTADFLASTGMSGPFSPLVAGAVGGAATGTATDLKGVAGEAALGAVVSRLAALGSDRVVQPLVRRALSKAPVKPPTLAQAEVLKREAYDAVDASGFRFPKTDVAKLADDFERTLSGSAYSKSAKEEAASIIDYTRKLAKEGDVSLSQLEKLRGDIYTALSKKGGDTAVAGNAFRQQIDTLMDGSGDDLVRNARALNARFKKADYVTRASQSADLAAEKTYGGDYGRKLKDRVAPLVDPLKKQTNFRGATPDETAALNKLARGTKTQNLASTVGGMTDPRRMGGKILAGALGGMTGTAGVVTGGTSLPLTLGLQGLQIGAGLGLTGASSKIARNNLDDLIKLILAGGSKQALAPVATPASEAAEKAVVNLLRPAGVALAAPALAASRRPDQGRPAPRPKPKAKRSGRSQ